MIDYTEITWKGMASDLQKKKEQYQSNQKNIDRLAEVSSLIKFKQKELDVINNSIMEENTDDIGLDLNLIKEALEDCSNLKVLISDISKRTESNTKIMENLAVYRVKEEKIFETLSFLLDKTTLKYIDSLEATLSKTYSSIFQRLYKTVSLKIGESRGKKVLTLSISKQIDEENSIDIDLRPGSVTMLLGTILNLYYIILNDLPRVVLFDETFGVLDDLIIERFFQVLKVFVDELGFSFLIITQDPGVSALASRLYVMNMEGLELRRDLA